MLKTDLHHPKEVLACKTKLKYWKQKLQAGRCGNPSSIQFFDSNRIFFRTLLAP